MDFEIIGVITEIETIAVGRGIRERARLRKHYGRGRWRKRKGIARVRLSQMTRSAWPNSIGTKRRESAERNSKSSGTWIDTMPTPRRRLMLCLRNDGYEVSLERRKIYAALPDQDAEKHGQVRVIDESGEDYLYPARYFAAIELPQAVRRAMLATG